MARCRARLAYLWHLFRRKHNVAHSTPGMLAELRRLSRTTQALSISNPQSACSCMDNANLFTCAVQQYVLCSESAVCKQSLVPVITDRINSIVPSSMQYNAKLTAQPRAKGNSMIAQSGLLLYSVQMALMSITTSFPRRKHQPQSCHCN